jgi:molybdopterin molybdotransferase
VACDVNSPPHDKSMMDGYAVISGDRAPMRRVVEEIAAGSVPQQPVTPGTAARIMTGAPLPAGADAVVPIEQTEPTAGGGVRLLQAEQRPGQHVLRTGASMRAGDTVARNGAALRPIEIAMLAEAGRALVAVRPRPRLAVLSTGNELVPVSERPAAGQIRNTNGPMLAAAANAAGGEAVELGVARDVRDELIGKIREGLASDVLLLSGGVSAGKFDLVPGVLGELGVQQVFHKVALRPGKPLWFGAWEGGGHRTLVFGLPGNPVSSFVCFVLFVRPAIAALAGRGFVGLSKRTCHLSHAYDHAGGRAAYLPARIDNLAALSDSSTYQPANVEILPWLGSADLAALGRSNGLVCLKAEPKRLEAGALVNVILI